MGRMRAAGMLGEVRLADLRFGNEEATALLTTSGLRLAPEDVDALVRRTEGWAAGLRLAALALADGADPKVFVAGFDGSDQTVAELLVEEVLSRAARRRAIVPAGDLSARRALRRRAATT